MHLENIWKIKFKCECKFGKLNTSSVRRAELTGKVTMTYAILAPVTPCVITASVPRFPFRLLSSSDS